MSAAYTGGCACGAVRFEVDAEPLFSNHCQCRDCQRMSGTGHGSYLTFPRGSVTQTGATSAYAMTGDSGNVKTRAFCTTCGAPLFMTFAAMPEVFTVHVASLDDPGRFRPQASTYAAHGLAWDRLDPAVPAFDRMPPR